MVLDAAFVLCSGLSGLVNRNFFAICVFMRLALPWFIVFGLESEESAYFLAGIAC